MNTMHRRRFNAGLASLALPAGLWTAVPAFAQAGFPNKPITLVVPNAPGGAIDILARLLEAKLKDAWGQPINVVYKPGAGTVLGTDFTAKSPPDGHTMCLVVTSHVINPSLRKSMPFDTVKDLAGVSLLATSPIAISATPGLPANNLKELIELAKKQPGKLTYASPGSGSSMHLAAEMLKTMAGLDILHAPYKGSGPAFPDVFAGRVEIMFDPLFSSLPHIKAGRMKVLAVISPQRSPIAPEVPAAVETLPGYVVQSVFGLVVPGGTPKDAVARIAKDVNATLANADVRTRMADIGLVPLGTSPAEFDTFIRTEIDKWAVVVKASGATAD
jgi:tripartite-type tricarboxylate transporter receptor subunit TctC